MKMFGRCGRALAAVAAAAGLVIAGAGVAHAGLRQYQDGFEDNPGAAWAITRTGSGEAGFDFGLGNARSARNNGWLHSGYSLASAATEEIRVPTGSGGRSDCVAQVYANPLNNRTTAIEVYVYNSAGTLLTSSIRGLSFTGYQAVQSNQFVLYGYQTVMVRFRLYDSGRGYDGEWLRLDDFTLTCSY
ncbi:hypothetical protein [Amycolatopsis sp. H20-H5]|uniref:hypothetical protein n=1 Tax=Amycolatopsis sp. H20-H5 TaxID=3046309 RepID=UPI002DBF1FCE|nr:hypothetical protein [Amycolatopsis sp. H20-H5]MEC3979975.1 hypothetical protein [Amycolatopsis sp. H20-H5]